MAIEQFPIEAGHVLMFARAIGDPNPIYADADVAAADRGRRRSPPRRRSYRRARSSTPTTRCAQGRRAVVRLRPRGHRRDADRAVGGGEAAAAGRRCTPSSTTSTTARCVAGDVLHARRPQGRDVGEAGTLGDAEVHRDSSPSTSTRTDELVITAAASGCDECVERRARSERRAQHSLKVGDSKEPQLVDDLTRTQIVMYAGASGDYNPLHSDEKFATRGRRLPGRLRPRHADDGHDRPMSSPTGSTSAG